MFYSERTSRIFSFAKHQSKDVFVRYISPKRVNEIFEALEFKRGLSDVNSALQGFGLEVGDKLGGDKYSIHRIGGESILNAELEDMRNGRFIINSLKISVPHDAERLDAPKPSEETDEPDEPKQLELF